MFEYVPSRRKGITVIRTTVVVLDPLGEEEVPLPLGSFDGGVELPFGQEIIAIQTKVRRQRHESNI